MNLQQRFDLIMNRQGRFQWGDVYIPSTLAVPREAPKGSRITRLNSRKLGRALHALSTPERVFTQLALHCPLLFDLHEQKMLWPYSASHPLRGHPLTYGTFPPPVRGTTEIAKEIGFKHHEITVSMADGVRRRMPFPYQGDLLLYLQNCDGKPFAVNWSIKDRSAAFAERRLSSAKTPSQQRKDRDHAEQRAELERAYYASAGIRTQQLSLDQVSSTVHANLDLVFGMHGLPLTHSDRLLMDFSADVAHAVRCGDPVAYVALRYGRCWGAPDQFIARIYQDIWERRLVVNFHKPILIDHPLDTEDGDLLDVFSSFFEEHSL
ncbi:hypothetical protein TRP66_11380 [Pseudomonas sp. JDS28PS106]|uniref:hypothetical protein n=1 Tax=Pseudomonas sp. JDS28PS106 TaxID=2497235 RepID=UPI002FD0EB97